MNCAKSKPVRFTKYEELHNLSSVTGIDMSKLLEKAWTCYKSSKEYATLVLFSKKGD